MYCSMAELATRCRHARLQRVIVAVARLMPRNVLTHPSLHIVARGSGQSFDAFTARWI